MQIGDLFIAAVRAVGAREVFGLPGDFALPLFKALEESSDLPVYTLSHEPGVGFAADAAARLHGRPSVAAVTYGAGAFNILNPVAAAYAEKSPVIVVSGGPGAADRGSGLGVHHQAKHLRSQLDIFTEVTCAQTVLDDAETAPAELARVLSRCLAESRPVYIEVPRDQVFVNCAPLAPGALVTAPATDPEALAACVDEIMARLEGAAAPVLLVGIETRRFGVEQEAGELAARLGVPVTTTFMGRGLLSRIGAEFAGSYMGVAGDAAVTDMVESSDALIMLGVLLSDTNFGISARHIDLRKAVLIGDGQVSIGFHTYPNMPVADVVSEMHRRVASRALPALASPRERYPYGLAADDEPITPADIATAINDVFDEIGPMPIAADMGDCLFTAFSIENTELVAPGYYATMGYGVPAGIGVEVATGRRPLVLVGDGAFQMTGWELLNCPRYGLSPVVIVFNNASWEMLRAFQPESAFNNLDALDFSAIARSLGGEGHVATTRAELQAALRRAVSRSDTFQLIDARIPRGVLSPTLQRFVDGFKRMRAGGD